MFDSMTLLWGLVFSITFVPSLGSRHVKAAAESDSDLHTSTRSAVKQNFLRRVADPEILGEALRSLGLDQDMLKGIPQKPLGQRQQDRNHFKANTTGLVMVHSAPSPSPSPANPSPPPPAPPSPPATKTQKAFFGGGQGWDHSQQKVKYDSTAMVGAMSPIFNTFGDMLGTWCRGKSVSRTQWMNLGASAAKTVITVAAQMASNAIIMAAEGTLDVLLGGMVPVLGGMLSALISSLFQIGAPSTPTAGQLINQAMAKERMRKNKDFFESLSEEFEVFSEMFPADRKSVV